MKKTAIIIGATGLVGNQLLRLLAANSNIERVKVFVRRPIDFEDPKIEIHIIDFDKPADWQKLVRGDLLFSTLGTTLKTAKTKENQYKVDFTYQYNFAKIAFANGVSTYILVSSMGANSGSAIFYSRIKGELEVAIREIGFKSALVFRPSILLGDRKEKRFGEKIGLIISTLATKFIFKKYRPTPAKLLAEKMIRVALEEKSGFGVIENNKILER